MKWDFIPLGRRLWTPPVDFSMIVVDAETGVFMMLYLDLAHDQAKAEGRLRSLHDLQDAIMHGAVKRIRPKFMTVATMFIGLVPIMWSMGAGADVMRRIVAPMIGGIFTSFLLELLVYPAIYEVWKWNFELKKELARRVCCCWRPRALASSSTATRPGTGTRGRRTSGRRGKWAR